MAPPKTKKKDSKRLTPEQRIELYIPYLEDNRGYKWIHKALMTRAIHIPRPTIQSDIRTYRKTHPKTEYPPQNPGIPHPNTQSRTDIIPHTNTPTSKGGSGAFDWDYNMEQLGKFTLKEFMKSIRGEMKCVHCGGVVEVVKDPKVASSMIDKYAKLYGARLGTLRLQSMLGGGPVRGLGDLSGPEQELIIGEVVGLLWREFRAMPDCRMCGQPKPVEVK